MFTFGTLLFFSITGFTLNHTDWFGGDEERLTEITGALDSSWLSNQGDELPKMENDESDFSDRVDRLSVAEYLRKTHNLKGAVSNFSVDEFQCIVVFAGPAYSADIFVDRETGDYEGSVSELGVIAMMNDLHKGRDSGPVWKSVIDVSAILCTLVSITGLWLLIYIRGRWRTGLVTGFVGCLLLWIAYYLFVP